jgi:hypothetical protein
LPSSIIGYSPDLEGFTLVNEIYLLAIILLICGNNCHKSLKLFHSLLETAALPSAALGKAPSAKIRSAKASLLRAVYRALNKAFVESLTFGKAQNKKMQEKPEFFFNRGRGPLASARPMETKSQVAAFFVQNSRLRGRWDSNS